MLGTAVVALGPVAFAAPAVSAPPTAAGSAALTGIPSAVGPSGIGIDLEQLGTGAVTPGSQLVVRVQVTNTSGAVLDGARARLFVNSPVLTSRAALDAWAAGQGASSGDRFAQVDGAEQPLGRSLAPGESTEVDFSVRADQLDLGSTFGPRGVTIDVLDSSLQRLTALRTFLVWAPQSSAQATAPLTVVAPVTAGAPDVGTGQLPEEQVEDQLGRLRDLLPAMSLPSTSLVVDPALLGPFAQPAQQGSSASPSGSGSSAGASPSGASGASSAGSSSGSGATATPSATGGATTPPVSTTTTSSSSTAGSDPTSSGGTGGAPALTTGTAEETSPELQSWLDLLRARTGSQTAVLPQGDTDVVATAAAGTSDLLALAVAQSRTTLEGDDEPALLWPADPSAVAPQDLVVEAAAATRQSRGPGPAPAVLVDARSVPGAVGGNGTSAAVATLTTKASDGSTANATGVLVDASASALLASAASDGSSVDAAEASARLLADTAVSAVDGGGVVLALPRGWDPDASVMASVLGPVSSAPWVRATSLPDLLSSGSALPVVSVEQGRAAQADSGATGTPLPASGLQAAEKAVVAAEAVAPVVQEQDRQALLQPVQRSATAAAALGWRSDQQGWQQALEQLAQTATRLGTGLEIVRGSTTTVISSRVNLPVTVRNALPQSATVLVHLRSANLRLVPGDPVELTVAPGSDGKAQIPVRAAASGDTWVTVYLTDPQGKVIGKPEDLRVRVRADWEGRGVAVAAAVAGLVFVGGVVRTVLRVRNRPAPPVVRSAEEADTDGPPTRRPEESTRG
nr:DUF6049 family protein [Quadrisphaera sp. RL12-1S]